MAAIPMSSLSACAVSFEALLSETQLWEDSSSSVFPELWQNAKAKLRSWMVDVGDESQQMSLEYRLRRALDIDNQVRSIASKLDSALGDLRETLEAATDPTLGDKTMTPAEKDGEMIDIYLTIEEHINTLFQLTPTIMQPGGPRNGGGCPDDVKVQCMAGDVENRYLLHDHRNPESLASAMQRRWRHLNHLSNKRMGMRSSGGSPFTEDASRAGAFAPPSRVSLGTWLHPFPLPNTMSASKSTHLPAEWTENEFVTLPTSVTVPLSGLHPKSIVIIGQSTFECPGCLMPVTVSTKEEWNKHLYQDIMPYTCVFANCRIPGRVYGQKSHLFHHFESDHVNNLALLMCPLCREDQQGPYELQLHIAKHLEDTALSVLESIELGAGQMMSTDPRSSIRSGIMNTQVHDPERAAMETAWTFSVEQTLRGEGKGTRSAQHPEQAAIQAAWSSVVPKSPAIRKSGLDLAGTLEPVPVQDDSFYRTPRRDEHAEHKDASLKTAFATDNTDPTLLKQQANAETRVAGSKKQRAQKAKDTSRASVNSGRPFAKPFAFRIKHVHYQEDPTASPTDCGPDVSWRPSASARFTSAASSGWWM